MLSAPAELRLLLAAARERGLPWREAWAHAVHRVVAGRSQRRMWVEVFTETADAWRRSYEGSPATSADRAFAVLAETDIAGHFVIEDAEPVERCCRWCRGTMQGRAPQARYCCRSCEREAACERQRAKRKAAQDTRPVLANSHGPRESSPERVAA